MFDSELSILVIYGLVVAITVILQTTGAMGQLGVGYFLSSRDAGKSASGMTARMERAGANSLTAMTLFAPAVVILALKDAFGDTTLIAAQVFLVARIVYLPAYAFGITGLRTLAWMAGFLATVSLYFLAL